MKKENVILLVSIIVAVLLPFLGIFVSNAWTNANLVVDTGASVYAWQLAIRDNLTMIIVWIMFITHFSVVGFLTYKRRSNKERTFNKLNWAILLTNLGFIIMHFVQSYIWYDGLAQDVPVWSSQWSVIFILVVLIIMLNPRRGFFFGWKLKLNPKVYKILHLIHGPLFLLALTYTFWFHPMVFTIGHYFGFLYMFLFFIQLSFVKTNTHLNKYWIVSLEFFVALHAFAIAFFIQDSAIWAMFVFGFSFMFFFTQMYLLSSNKKILRIISITFLVAAIIFYLFFNPMMWHQIFWIPFIEYLTALVLAYLLALIIYIKNKAKIKT